LRQASKSCKVGIHNLGPMKVHPDDGLAAGTLVNLDLAAETFDPPDRPLLIVASACARVDCRQAGEEGDESREYARGRRSRGCRRPAVWHVSRSQQPEQRGLRVARCEYPCTTCKRAAAVQGRGWAGRARVGKGGLSRRAAADKALGPARRAVYFHGTQSPRQGRLRYGNAPEIPFDPTTAGCTLCRTLALAPAPRRPFPRVAWASWALAPSLGDGAGGQRAAGTGLPESTADPGANPANSLVDRSAQGEVLDGVSPAISWHGLPALPPLVSSLAEILERGRLEARSAA
jgi:hypothetical protein